LAPAFARKNRWGQVMPGSDLFGTTLEIAGAGVSEVPPGISSAKGWVSCYQFFLLLLAEPALHELNRPIDIPALNAAVSGCRHLNLFKAARLHVGMGMPASVSSFHTFQK